MDIITQGVLGAAVGQAGFSGKLGRRALGWGAVIGMLPDLDIIVTATSNPFAEILYHRGITHSIWFGPVIGPVLGYLLWCYYSHRDSLSSWIGLSIWALVTHPLLDLFTVYGTQLLAPLSNHRFSLSAIPIIDPIYTGLLTLSIIFGCLYHRRIWASITVASIALTLTSGYLFYGLAQNEDAYTYAQDQLKEEGRPHGDVRVYTTMFQIFLRRIVVHFPDEVWIGFVTTWAPKKIIWHKQPQAPEAVRAAILNHPYGKIYRWFTSDELILRPYNSQNGSNQNDSTQWDMLDGRFGLPGSTLLGIWGRRVTMQSDGTVQDDFPGFRVPLNMALSEYESIWKAAFGKGDLFLR
jgi:inner membrane protein